MIMDKKVRRHLLKPLQRRRPNSLNRKALVSALERFDEQALGELHLPDVVNLARDPAKLKSEGSWKDPIVVRRLIDLMKALRLARRISRQEYFFYALVLVEGIHEARTAAGAYERDLATTNAAMAEVERKHGLSSDQFWGKESGPKEYQALNRKYERVLDDLFSAVLAEFDLNELAEIRKSDPKEYDRLRERGRRTVFHKDDLKEALQDVVQRYERDARRAAAAEAYSAAITLLGAGLEGLLLLRCIRSKKKAQRVAAGLPARVRPRNSDDLSNWRFETLIDTCLAAGWLPPLTTDAAQYNPAGMAHFLRRMRNFVHPAKQARERPWIEAEEADWKDAEAIYVALISTVRSSSGPASQSDRQ
jgi:hypothetical protein